jgi:ketosteroid isomerase-like protein
MTTRKSDRPLRVTRRTAVKYGASTLALVAAMRSIAVPAVPKRRASIWTDDGTVAPPQEGLFQGREAMAKHFETETRSIRPDSKANFSNYRFRFINSDTAFVDAELILNNVLGPDGAVAPAVCITVASTAVRQGKDWRIQDQRAHFASRP